MQKTYDLSFKISIRHLENIGGIVKTESQTDFESYRRDVKMSKTLVSYFSASGVTAKAAKTLAQALGADLYEIKPATPYTSDDLNWMNKKSRSSVEMNDPASRPEIADEVENMDQYDTVCIGFPIWWYIEPRIIDTFLESYDFSGKKLVPFATSGGSGMANVVKNLRKQYPELSWEDGKLLNGVNIAQWAKEI